MFRDELKVVLNSLNIIVSFGIKDVLFRIYTDNTDTDNISILVNYILLESQCFTYRCNLNKGSLSMRLLGDKFKENFQTERFIAKKKQQNPFPR